MFKDVFVELLQTSEVSSYKLTKDTGISNGLISAWKKGDKVPSSENLIKLSDYFNPSAPAITRNRVLRL